MRSPSLPLPLLAMVFYSPELCRIYNYCTMILLYDAYCRPACANERNGKGFPRKNYTDDHTNMTSIYEIEDLKTNIFCQYDWSVNRRISGQRVLPQKILRDTPTTTLHLLLYTPNTRPHTTKGSSRLQHGIPERDDGIGERSFGVHRGSCRQNVAWPWLHREGHRAIVVPKK